MANRIVSILWHLVWMFIWLLLFFGGWRSRSDGSGIEVSQLNVFGIVLFSIIVIAGLRQKLFKSSSDAENKDMFLVPGADFLGRIARRPWVPLVYAAVFSVALLLKYYSFNVNAFDVGYIQQALWSTAHLSLPKLLTDGLIAAKQDFLFSTLSKGQIYFGEHFSPVLLGLVPFYRIFSHFFVLVLAKFFLIFGVFILCQKWFHRQVTEKHNPGIWFLFLLPFLFYDPLRAGLLFDFREDIFFLFFFTVYLYFRNTGTNILICVIPLIASLTVKENAPIVVLLVGLVELLYSRKKSNVFELMVWVLVCVGSLVWFWVLNHSIMPIFAGGAQSTVLSSRLTKLGGSPSGIVHKLFFEPLAFFGALQEQWLDRRTLKYVWQTCAPIVMLMVLRPMVTKELFVGLGLTLMNVLMSARTVGFHYELIVIPFFFFHYFKVILTLLPSEGSSQGWNLSKNMTLALIAVSFVMIGGRSPLLYIRQWWPTSAQIEEGQALRAIPTDWAVFTQSDLFTQMDCRKNIFLFSSFEKPKHPKSILVLDSGAEHSFYATPALFDRVRAGQMAFDGWQLVYRDKNLWIYFPLLQNTNANLEEISQGKYDEIQKAMREALLASGFFRSDHFL